MNELQFSVTDKKLDEMAHMLATLTLDCIYATENDDPGLYDTAYHVFAGYRCALETAFSFKIRVYREDGDICVLFGQEWGWVYEIDLEKRHAMLAHRMPRREILNGIRGYLNAETFR